MLTRNFVRNSIPKIYNKFDSLRGSSFDPVDDNPT